MRFLALLVFLGVGALLGNVLMLMPIEARLITGLFVLVIMSCYHAFYRKTGITL